MSKETTIVFLYDTELLKNEEDDPNSAILYFHPSWVSDQQKLSLCGQIIGSIYCLRNAISMPRIISLQCGKFCIVENGRYIFAVGTDRNPSDWVLEHRTNVLYGLINFYYKDFETLGAIYSYDALCAKLYYIFEAFLKVLSFGGNVFTNMPSLTLPKIGNNVFSEAVGLLQQCHEYENILGGTLLYHNKVVATQLSPNLTKQIVLSDPYNLKCTTDVPELQNLPTEVQILQVYISNKEYTTLLEHNLKNKSIIQYSKPQNNSISTKSTQDITVVSTVKRDQSLLFMTVPEESIPEHKDNLQIKPARPKFLNLKSVSIESNKNSFLTPYHGSYAPTPMTELKKFVEEENNAENKQTKNNDVIKIKKKNGSMSNIKNVGNNDNSNLKQIKSVADPTFPMFKTDGTTISKLGYDDWGKGSKSVQNVDSCKFIKSENFNTCLSEQICDKNEIKNESTEEEMRKLLKEKRKSLTLPLKSLTDMADTENLKSRRRYSQGVQLTPLMTKLSILANEQSNLNNIKEILGEFNVLTPSQPNFKFIFDRNTKDLKNIKLNNPNAFKKCYLFVYGQDNIVLTLILKPEITSDEQTILKIKEICRQQLSSLERQLDICVKSQSASTSTSTDDHYSYLHLNSEWDTIKCRGPLDFKMLNTIHQDFMDDRNDISEIILRRNDCVMIGQKSGQSELFYQESSVVIGGLPTPSDAMGLVQSKAKRRLEKDTVSLK